MNAYATLILKAMDRLEQNGTAPSSQDKSNVGTLLARAFLWQEVLKIAKKRSDAAFDELILATETEDETRERGTGDHIIKQVGKFAYLASVTNPMQTFDPSALVTALNKSKYKIPAPIAKEFIDNAKKQGKRRLTTKVTESDR